jgi:ABC-type multidrug transport system ATPase subunit
LTVGENLRYFAGILGARRERVDEVVEIVGLGTRADRGRGKAGAVSGHRIAARTSRVLRQLRHDPRTVALLLLVPCVLQLLVHELFRGRALGDFSR